MKIKTYSIQRKEAYEHALHCGFLVGYEKYIDKDFIQSYKWMIGQMKSRIGHDEASYPIWLWPKRPDLRSAIYAYASSREFVLLEITVAEDKILGSDFDAWHYVLNQWKLGHEDEEIDLVKSWERIFDYEFLRAFDERCIEEQYVVGRIDIGQVKLIKKFKTK